MVRESNRQRDFLEQSNHLLKITAENIESKTDLKRTREIFETMIYCIERPLKNADHQIESLGIKIINPIQGEEFLPSCHESVNSSKSSLIKRSLRKGFLYKDFCLKPALVELESEEVNVKNE